MQDVSHPATEPRERTIAKSALKHRELNYAIFNLAMLEFHASDTLERGTMFVEIVEGLVLRPKRRLKLAHLPSRANRKHEGNDSCPLSDSVFGTTRTLLGM